jgi:hypothetical protein
MQERRKNTVLYKQELNAKKLSRQDPNFRKKENQKQVDFKRKARGFLYTFFLSYFFTLSCFSL